MIDSQQLDLILRRAAYRRRLFAAGTAIAMAMVLAIVASLGAVSLDAFFALTAHARVAVNGALAAFALGAAVYITRVIIKHAYNPRVMARLIEKQLHLNHNPLVNAVQLDQSAPDTSASSVDTTSHALRQLAIKQGLAQARAVDTTGAIDNRLLRKNIFILATVVFAFVGMVVFMPRVFSMVLPRYFNPSADLPPFTLVRFDIGIDPPTVPFGHSTSITAKLAGPIVPGEANVVFVDQQTTTSVPMASTDTATFILPIDSLTQTINFYIQTPHGRSKTHTLAPSMSPLVKNLTATYQYPAYTQWPDAKRNLLTTPISGLLGSTLILRLQSNVPLASGVIRLNSKSQPSTPSDIPLTPVVNAINVLEATFPLTSSGTYRISLIGADGSPAPNVYTGAITVKPDAPPRIQILEPDLRVMAPEGWVAPLAFAANDDIAVARIDIKYRLNEESMAKISSPLKHRGPTYASTSHPLSLQSLGAMAGDTITGFATAFDNHPPPIHAADSASFQIKVISQAEYEQRAREQYTLDQINEELLAFDQAEQELNARREKTIEELAKLQEELEQNDGKLSEASQQKLEALQQEIESQRQDAAALAEAMRERAEQPGLYEFEEAIREQLNQTADRLEQASQPPPPSATSNPKEEIADALDQLRQQQDEADQARSQSEMTAAQMQQLSIANRLMSYADWVMDITRRQRELAERFAEYRDKPVLMFDDQVRLNQLAQEQSELAKELAGALSELSATAQEAEALLPTMSATATEFFETIEDMRVVADQNSAAAAARSMFGRIAHHDAVRAAESLESLIGQCRSMGGQASDSIDGAFGMSTGQMGAMMNQLGQSRMGAGSKFGAGKGSGGGAASMNSSNPNGPSGQMTLAGPHFSSPRAGSKVTKKRTGAYGTVGAPDEFNSENNTPQSIEPDITSLRQSNPSATYNVPPQYRRLSDEYFRRLARDPKATPTQTEDKP